MGKAHDELVSYYANPDNLKFLDNKIYKVICETPLCRLYKLINDEPLHTFFRGVLSPKIPDFCALTSDNSSVYFGEIKGRNAWYNRAKAEDELKDYLNMVLRHNIPAKGVVIADDFVKVLMPVDFLNAQRYPKCETSVVSAPFRL